MNIRENNRKSFKITQLSYLGHFLKPYWKQVIAANIALILAAITVLAFGQGLKTLIDHGFVTGNKDFLNQAVWVFLFISILLGITTFARFYLVSWIGEKIVSDIRQSVFNHVINLDISFFDKNKTGEILSTIVTDTSLLQTVVGSSISIALRNVLLFIGGVTMLAFTSFKLTSLVLLIVPLVIVPIVIFGRRVRKFSKANQDCLAEMSGFVNETISSIRVVQAFVYEKFEQQNYSNILKKTFETAKIKIHNRALLTAMVIILTFSSICIILWIGGHDVISGKITAGQLSAFVFYAVIVAGALGALSEVFGDLQRAAGAMERILDLLNLKIELPISNTPLMIQKPIEASLAFNNVSFAYQSNLNHFVIKDYNLSIKSGEKIALVGPSGAGKTTIFQLALRFYDPQQGEITFNGIDLRHLTFSDLRAQIGLVSQDPVIFSSSALDNIRYGCPNATEQDIKKAADAACVTEFIEKLPQRFLTPLGERGIRLSGGQRQRLAIARAMLRQPNLLLLDEATSALDSENESLIQQALERLMIGRTTLIIAHRLSTVMKADRIVVMDKGKIVGIGTHNYLLDNNSLYNRLATLQFDQNYKNI
ncbi:MAG: ATP-binding cassette domain-containing protein [Alphaproteobacteria bacterium]|nr:ATP-binding cassette domain-containing protein [Alphaproteobacteria bacterium]